MSHAFFRWASAALLAAAVAAPVVAEAKEPLPFINLQLRPWTVVAQERGILKEEFDKVGIPQVNLIASGTAELVGAESAALNKGAIAIAQRMVYPATVHRANGLDAVIVWLSEPSDKYRTPILARASNNEVNELKDLEGKKFASSRISCYFTSPFEALNKAGVPLDSRLKQGKVRYQSIDNTAATNAALLSGAIDATAAHLATNNAAALWLSGEVKVVGRSPDDGVYVNGAGRVSYFAMREFVDEYPEAVKAFLTAHERAKKWISENIDEASQIIAEGTRVPVEIAKFQITDPSTYEFMKGETNATSARENIKRFQAWYVENGDDILTERQLTAAQIDDFVDARFFAGGEYSVYN
ncbi:ABC-type nitrate/sulfonate/bicarbonate transport system substrate-binding protein [Pseudochelatococcus lubricantis]|uniref:ABC-type nitrate/sulfonate/bicarbonate transport system substrate-binding protein n=1 Tax=Pseudochelatococcus lubricantis TaxID=1538102 RepID=A0ABX0V387_9HYPH|nr:ABC transporter substrate-binding protein [Pseudochelatococcus lubricantis]NIJ59689.1 ABC-type nitrate/sulfonate/bicarbonate transport system substrate-binding protein [Pseudochelatococcus lubricantis]